MRRSEECNSTAGDGRRFRARRQTRPESDRRDRGRQPRALREGRGRRTRLPFLRFPKRRACAVETPIPGRRPRETGHGLPRGIGAERSWPGARTVISGRRGRRFRWGAKRPYGIAEESLASALALPRGRDCRPVPFPERRLRRLAGRSAETESPTDRVRGCRRLPLRGSVSFRERSCLGRRTKTTREPAG